MSMKIDMKIYEAAELLVEKKVAGSVRHAFERAFCEHWKVELEKLGVKL